MEFTFESFSLPQRLPLFSSDRLAIFPIEIGGFLIQLSNLYPDLNFVLRDREPVLRIAERILICDQLMISTLLRNARKRPVQW